MTFNANPLTQEEHAEFDLAYGEPLPDGQHVVPDWAESLTLARLALRELDDAFPREDADDIAGGYERLRQATFGLRKFLLARNLEVL